MVLEKSRVVDRAVWVRADPPRTRHRSPGRGLPGRALVVSACLALSAFTTGFVVTATVSLSTQRQLEALTLTHRTADTRVRQAEDFLREAVSTGNQVYRTSAGRVPDDAVRVALAGALEDAQDVLPDEERPGYEDPRFRFFAHAEASIRDADLERASFERHSTSVAAATAAVRDAQDRE
jgi:hypothetical protein